MLANLFTETSGVENLLYWVEWVSLIIEAMAVLIIVVAIINALVAEMEGCGPWQPPSVKLESAL